MKHNKGFVRFLSILTSVTMLVGLLPMTVFADPEEGETSEEAIEYAKYEQVITCTEYTKLSEVTTNELSDGWYYLDRNCSFSETLVVSGDEVSLILGTGYTLSANDGIKVTASKFTVYPEVGNGGKIYAASSTNPGIELEEGLFEFYGGTLEAHGGSYAAGIGTGNGVDCNGRMNFYSGTVKAYGGDKGAGIGSGSEADQLAAFTFLGGSVTAEGGWNGAGIGGGWHGNAGSIFLYGGTIKATGKGVGPGIGGYQSADLIYLQESRKDEMVYVTAEGGADGGAGLGSAASAGTFTGAINLFSSDFTVKGKTGAAGIGGGYGVTANLDVTINPNLDSSIRGTVIAGEYYGQYGEAIGDGLDAADAGNHIIRDNSWMVCVLDGYGNPVKYEDWDVAFAQNKVHLAMCEHPDKDQYEGNHYDENGYAKHLYISHCDYCKTYQYTNSYLDFHSFDPDTHECVCGQVGHKLSVIGVDSSTVEYFYFYQDGYVPDGTTHVYVDADRADRDFHVTATYVDPVSQQVCSIDDVLYAVIGSGSYRLSIKFDMPDTDVILEVHPVMVVSFEANGGDEPVAIAPVKLEYGSTYTLPQCDYTAPEGQHFAGWTINGSETIYVPGYSVVVDSDLTLTAQWADTICEHNGEFTYTPTATGHMKICAQCHCAVAEENHVDNITNETNSGYKDYKCDLCGADVSHVYFYLNESDLNPYIHEVISKGSKVSRPVPDPFMGGKNFYGWQTTSGDFFDFDTPITDDNFGLLATWDLEAVTINSASAVFTSGMQLQFTLGISPQLSTDDQAYIVFEKEGKEIGRKLLSNPDGTSKTGAPQFRVEVPILDYTKVVTVKVFDGDGDPVYLLHPDGKTLFDGNACEYSLKQYAVNVITNPDSSQEMRDLALYLSGYYEFAKIYFADDGTDPGYYPNIYNFTVTDEVYAKNGAVMEGNAPGVTGASLNVNFQTKNTLRVTFKLDGTINPSEYDFYFYDGISNSKVEPDSVSSTRCTFYVEDISAPNLAFKYRFAIVHRASGAQMTVEASVLSYCILAVEKGSPDMRSLAKALYCYGEAAKNYFDSISD
ncbi:MAG: InlB B-repeat-containing protein [Clostridiales bacterium]|nr:InlB B-repeat-containing protein [Clostridiales bacterium]